MEHPVNLSKVIIILLQFSYACYYDNTKYYHTPYAHNNIVISNIAEKIELAWCIRRYKDVLHKCKVFIQMCIRMHL